MLEGFRPSVVHAQEYRQQQASNRQARKAILRGFQGFF
jgi:hypothetical protein